MPARRRVLSLIAAGAVVASPVVSAALADGDALPADYPTDGCFTYEDPKGDATFEVFANDPDLDLLGAALETTDTSLKAYAKVDALSDSGPNATDGHRFTLRFTFNGHVFAASGSDYGMGTGAIREGLAATGQAAHTTQLGVDTPAVDPTDPNFFTNKGFVDSGLTVTFDYDHSWVVWDLPIADIEKYGEAKFEGDLTAVAVVSQTDEYAVGSQWDSTVADNGSDSTDTWTVGDNACFGGSADTAVIKNLGATTVQYGDAASVAAKVVDADGHPIAGAPVTFAVDKADVTAKTNVKGVAKAQLRPTAKAGRHTLVTSVDAKGVSATTETPFKVVAERTALKLTAGDASARKVTLTGVLTDDDKHAVKGQKVAWAVNGKAAGSSTTNRAGKVTFTSKGIKAGDVVTATFSAVKGEYAGAAAKHRI
jgi:hypothetical protein